VGYTLFFIMKISISKSANLTIELETLTDGAASITATKNKKSSTTVMRWAET
jgi:hypothetical protein